MKYYEIQELEARARSILAGFDVREEVIDALIENNAYKIPPDPSVYKTLYENDPEGFVTRVCPFILGEVTMSPQYNPDPTTVSAF
ncbi:hypothetical protein LCGC14_2379620, partial [marine sediment metagenome]